MLIHLDDIQKIFQKIQRKQGQYTSLIIYVSYNTDSLCALNIFKELLENESILYSVIPINGSTDLNKNIDSQESNKHLRSIVMINCGGLIDFEQKWVKTNQKIKIYIFDFHMPIHHNNIYSQKQVIIVDDGHIDFTLVPAIEDFEQSQYNTDQEDQDDDDDEEQYLS